MSEPDTPADDETAGRLAEIRSLAISDPGAYWHESVQSEELALMAGKSLAEARPVSMQTAEGRELVNIRDILRTAPEKYTPEMEARHLELIQIQIGEREANGSENWGSQEPARQAGLRVITEIRRSLPIENWQLMESSFDALSDAVQESVQRELMRRGDFSVTPAKQSAVDLFATTPEGKALVREWGAEAPWKLARIQARMWAVIDPLSDADHSELSFWFNALESNEAKAVLRALAR